MPEPTPDLRTLAVHREAVRIVASQKRGKRLGLLMLCAAPECHGAEVFAPGHSVADVVAAADAHIAETESSDA